jgi:hypothetical protein
MKYILESEEFTYDDLDNLNSMMTRIKRFGEERKRKSISDDNKYGYKLNNEYEEYFYYLMDDGWEYSNETTKFHGTIYIKKAMKRSDAESYFPEMINQLKEIKNRFTADGFNCHFVIDFDGIPQQEVDMKTYRNDIYKFNGVGNENQLRFYDSKYPPNSFPRDEYFLAKIQFIYI